MLPFVDLLPETAEIIDVRAGRRFDLTAIRHETTTRGQSLAALAGGSRCVAVIAEKNGADALFALFGAWAAGAMAVMVNPGLSATEKANVIAHAGANFWISEGGRLEHVGGADLQSRAGGPPGIDAPVLMMMTSGTTGVPKGIVHSMRSLSARVALNIAHIGEAHLARSLCVLPVFFGHGLIGNCMTPLAAGGKLYLWNSPQPQEVMNFPAIVDRERITFMSSVPTFWRLALRAERPAGASLERVHVGSAPLSTELWQQIADWCGTREVFNMFGMTETANWIGGAKLDEAGGRDGHIGHIWGGAYAVLADDGQVLRSGRGEALVQSPSIMLEYYGRPDLSEAAFAGNWFRTGDIGELDESGAMTLVGRMKSEINRGGIKVLAEEVDMLLERHPGIDEACAFGIPDPVSGEAVCAAVVLKPGRTEDAASIRAWCRDQVRADAVPSKIVLVDAIPRNDRGKIVRSQVREAVTGA